MLVKRSIVEKWYQTDSWVYKNFSYLFQNPLWCKKVPQGFSVCPYFWMSMFSMLIFRPLFVFPIRNLIVPTMKLIGKPAKGIDNLCKKLLGKLKLFSEDHLEGMTLGGGIFFTLLLSIVVVCTVALIALVGWKLYALYAYLKLAESLLGLFAYWSILSFLGMWATLFIHKLATDTECKTMNYLWVWLVLFGIAIGIYIPAEFMVGVGVVLSAIGYFLTWVGVDVIWMGICLAGKGIDIAFKWVVSGMWGVFSWTPIPYVPWWSFIIIFSFIGWFADKILGYFDNKSMDDLRTHDIKALYARYRGAWIDLFVRILIQHKKWKSGTYFFEDPNYGNSYQSQACKSIRFELYRAAFEKMWADKLNKLQTDYPMLKSDGWKSVTSGDDTSSRFDNLGAALVKTGESFYEYRSGDFDATLLSVCMTEFKSRIKDLADLYRADDDAQYLRRKQRKNSWSHLMCMKVTHSIGNGVETVGSGFYKVWCGIKWVCRQSWTLLAYLWMLLKAKKQGVCPYFVFVDPTKAPTGGFNGKPLFHNDNK